MKKKETFYDVFKKRRKVEGIKITPKIEGEFSFRYRFRGQKFYDIMYMLFSGDSLIDFESLQKARETGFVNIQNKGILYCRECCDLSEDDLDLLSIDKRYVTHSYDIEVIVKQKNLKEMTPLITSITDICGQANLLVKPQNIPDSYIFVWGSGKSYEENLISSLYDEFGSKSEISKLPDSLKSLANLEDKPAVLLKS